MQWLQDYWRKEGPGIPKDAPRKTGLALFAEIFVREWWEIVKLNLLFILASLPLVTIPASMAATARISVALTEDRNTYLLRDFSEAFVRYFWRATFWGIGLSGTIALGVLAVGTYVRAARDNLLMTAPLAVSLVATTFVAIVACQLLVLLVMRDLHPARLLRLSVLAAVMRPLPALTALLFVGGLWLVHVLFYPVSVFMPATLNFSLGMFAITFAVHRGAELVLALPEGTGGGRHGRDASQNI